MIFRIEQSGRVSIAVEGQVHEFQREDAPTALVPVMDQAFGLLDSGDFLHIEGGATVTLAHAGMPVADVSGDDIVVGLWTALSAVAGALSPRVLDRPALAVGEIAEALEPQLIDGEWVQGWRIRDMTEAERIASLPYKTAAEATAAMTAYIDRLTASIKAEYPEVVRQLWDEEEAIAAAYLAGTENAEQLAILESNAANADRTPAEHAQRILEKAQFLRQIGNLTRDLWLKTDKQIKAAESPHEYEPTLMAAMAQVEPLAQQYGLIP